MAAAPWGGSEELWAATARLALEQGHEVLVSVYDWGVLAPQIQQLVGIGAKVHTRIRNQPTEESWPSLSRRVVNFIKRKINPPKPKPFAFQAILDFSPSIVCISQGDTYTEAPTSEVRSLLAKVETPYNII
ncbi:MAG: hypothetical protein MUF12_06615, partial [Sediminibacterium sp.]|nr:hypothetical protein [Sediminibacterium sp.]